MGVDVNGPDFDWSSITDVLLKYPKVFAVLVLFGVVIAALSWAGKAVEQLASKFSMAIGAALLLAILVGIAVIAK